MDWFNRLFENWKIMSIQQICLNSNGHHGQSSFVAKGSDLLPQFANDPDDTLCNVLDAISY